MHVVAEIYINMKWKVVSLVVKRESYNLNQTHTFSTMSNQSLDIHPISPSPVQIPTI